MKVKLTDITDIIRSKNSGPYELTMDIMFSEEKWYKRVCEAKLINKELVSKLYKIPKRRIISIIEFDPAKAIKITIQRPICSGDPGETDVYGAQQHAPLLDVALPMPPLSQLAISN
jgi:hypothetical protein